MTLNKNLFLILISCCLLLTACGGRGRESQHESITVQALRHRNLDKTFRGYSYNWERLENGVPPIKLQQLPKDLHLFDTTAEKKRFFFQALLPMVLLGNQEIVRQREAMTNYFKMIDEGKALQLHQHEELIDIQRYYKISGDLLHDKEIRQRLLSRVDTIPPSLALAQAANESGWGLSRFAQHANNLFGEWTFTPGTGIIPAGRPPGATYEVRKFSSLYGSIRSYLRNLNTHRSYRTLRSIRLKLRQEQQPLSGSALAAGLRFYSTRRDAYVREIRGMIASNNLERLNEVTLLAKAEKRKPEPERIKAGLLSSRRLLRISTP